MNDFNFGAYKGEGPLGEAVFDRPQSFVRFYPVEELQAFKSKEAGRPVYRKVDMIEIVNPGEKDTCVREVQDWHKHLYRREWELYEAGREQDVAGTTLSVLFPSNPEIVAYLKSMKVHTVEQLGGLNDHAVQAIGMGALDFKQKAERFLAQSERGAAFEKQEQADKALAEMQAQLAQLTAENADLKAKKTKAA